MNAYMFQGALLCEECGIKAGEVRCANPRYIEMHDSNDFPQLVLDGGGEADSPSHCDACRVFLENPLTSDGEEWIKEEAINDSQACRAGKGVWREYTERYAYIITPLFAETD